MGSGLLRVPLRIAEVYCAPESERVLFPSHLYYLRREEVLEAFPAGYITHERFLTRGHAWRLVKRPSSQGTVYLAVLDDPPASSAGSMGTHDASTPTHNGNGYGYGNGYGSEHGNGTYGGGATHGTPDSVQRLRSMPLDSISSHDFSDTHTHDHDHHPAGPLGAMSNGNGATSASHCTEVVAAGRPPLHHSTSVGPGMLVRDRHAHSSSALAHAGSLPPLAQFAPPLPGVNVGNGAFMTDLLSATESPIPLDRFKAFVRLFSNLSRMQDGMGLPRATPGKALAEGREGRAAWDSPDAQELVKQMVMVGDCLAKFGTAEFVAGGNNSSRAITTKDYAKLLRMYLEAHGGVFRDDFIARLPVALQDEALAVRTLLQTRCETNDLLFTQLVRHVGQEPSGGGSLVINSNAVSANPTNHMLAAPKTLVNTVSNAWSKADVKRRTQMGALGAVAVVALWVLKRKLFGGGGGGGRRGGYGRRGEDSEWGGYDGGRARRGGGGRWWRGSGDIASRLLDERSDAERVAVRYLTACHDELRRASHNDLLLRHDWRLGPLRLALPGSGPVPDGYEPVQPQYCTVESYVNALDGGPLFAVPYAHGQGRVQGHGLHGGEREREGMREAGGQGPAGGAAGAAGGGKGKAGKQGGASMQALQSAMGVE